MTIKYELESEGVDENGIPFTNFKIVYDDPAEAPNYREQGEEFPCHYDDEIGVEQAVDDAIADANKTLPKGTVYEIRAKLTPQENYGGDFGRIKINRATMAETFAVAWYFLPRLKNEPLMDRFGVYQSLHIGMGGYNLIARLRVP